MQVNTGMVWEAEQCEAEQCEAEQGEAVLTASLPPRASFSEAASKTAGAEAGL